MADIRIVTNGRDFNLPNGASIYVDGHKLRHVLSVTITITLAVSKFEFGPESDG